MQNKDELRKALSGMMATPPPPPAPAEAKPKRAEAGNLISCPACEKYVSPSAASCPNCGHIIKRRQSATGLLAAIIIGLLASWVLYRIFV